MASLAVRSAASLPMEAMFLCPVWDFMCLRIVAGGQPGGECAALCLMADAMARMYGRAAHLREEHVSGWWMCLCTAWMVLLESVCIVMGTVMGREVSVRCIAEASAMKLSMPGRRHLRCLGWCSFSRKSSVM